MNFCYAHLQIHMMQICIDANIFIIAIIIRITHKLHKCVREQSGRVCARSATYTRAQIMTTIAKTIVANVLNLRESRFFYTSSLCIIWMSRPLSSSMRCSFAAVSIALFTILTFTQSFYSISLSLLVMIVRVYYKRINFLQQHFVVGLTLIKKRKILCGSSETISEWIDWVSAVPIFSSWFSVMAFRRTDHLHTHFIDFCCMLIKYTLQSLLHSCLEVCAVQ